jgi:hypothetical protein
MNPALLGLILRMASYFILPLLGAAAAALAVLLPTYVTYDPVTQIFVLRASLPDLINALVMAIFGGGGAGAAIGTAIYKKWGVKLPSWWTPQ